MATIVKATSSGTGIEKPMSYCESAWVTRGRQEDAERQPERGADQRGDDALVADHPARLPARHPIVRSIPSSRVRSNTLSTSVLTIPNRLTTTENARST